ncbi:hypothetical protein F511_32455 [Dorcoceras hygrometricum]|uniref:Uncharacterized protein n=1 Tax=Dorcoceras hygrometricum TaxID=472368 RepID=A0A2Z7DDZ8_9LAMI|nr:hypothetical protein F511_32455 [Dorcoceras hygrometricum]
MRIRPPELETSICDVKYHVSLAPGSNQNHRETGSSNVGGGRSSNQVHDRRGGGRRRPVAALKVADGGVARGGEGAAKLGITDSACKNQSVMVSVQYGPFNTYIPIRSTTIGKSRVAKDPITMHTSWRSNSDIASVTRVSMTFRVVRTNQYNQDLGLIHSTNGNHLESSNEGSSIDHQVPAASHLVARRMGATCAICAPCLAHGGGWKMPRMAWPACGRVRHAALAAAAVR